MKSQVGMGNNDPPLIPLLGIQTRTPRASWLAEIVESTAL